KMLTPIIRLINLALSLNCSAIILELIRVGIAASNTLIRAISPLIPNKIEAIKTNAGAIINLYSMDIEIWEISCFHPLNFNCNPTEERANGPTVAANLSKKGSAMLKSVTLDKISAPIQPIKGGKVSNLLTKTDAFIPSLSERFPLIAEIIPTVDKSTNITWSQMMAMLKSCSP